MLPAPSRRELLAGIASLVAAPRAATAAPRQAHRDDFQGDLRQWAIEAEQPSQVSAAGGVLDIIAPAGLTLWFRPVLTGPVRIDYEVQAVGEGGRFDRVSDVNCFWMARDPHRPDGDVLAAPRSGRFEDYDTLETYYVGLGGNGNSTTRFRRYVGRAGDRPLLAGNDRRALADMLVPNRWQHLTLRADGDRIRFARDGQTLFDFRDTSPYARGRFALRTTQSHLRVRNFAITETA